MFLLFYSKLFLTPCKINKNLIKIEKIIENVLKNTEK